MNQDEFRNQLDRIEGKLDRLLVPEKRGTPIYGDGISQIKVNVLDAGSVETEDAKTK